LTTRANTYMVSVKLIDWRHSAETKAAFERFGYEQNMKCEMPEETMFNIAQEFLHEGLNVMFLNNKDGGYLMCVDSYRFQQRG
jgi:hypothetical protein